MTKLIEYTIEVYKKDKRIKKDDKFGRNKVGLRFINVIDFIPSTKSYIDIVTANIRKQGFVVKVFETYVTTKNIVTGEVLKERYDTIHFCSPSSESFWSM